MSEVMDRWYMGLSTELRYLFDERAAVHQFDAGCPQYVAERKARLYVARLIRVHGRKHFEND